MKKSPFDLKYQNKYTDSKIIAALERISQAFRVLLWNESKTYALTPIQVQVLIFLLHHSDQQRKVSYLADEFNMTKATISDTVKTLEQKGFLLKEYEPHDTRSYVIHLTPEGRSVAIKTGIFSEEIKAPIGKLDPGDKESLLLSLMSIIHHLNKSGIITIQRMCFSCQYYEKDYQGHRHFCKMLNQKLENTELRVDCPEHLYAE